MENIRRLCLSDEKFMGQVARGLDEGKTHEQIAEEAGQSTTMSTHIFLKAIRVLTGKMGYEESKQDSKKHAFYKARKWVDDSSLSDAEVSHLRSIISRFEQENPPAQKLSETSERVFSAGVTPSVPSSSRASSPHVGRVVQDRVIPDPAAQGHIRSGVYVYSYPLYLNNHISPADGRTLYKVGASSLSMGDRVNHQASKTPVPEDIQLLRAFECSDAIKEERKFHRILTAAGHHHESNHGGIEWFLTRLEMVDAIAESLGLFDAIAERGR